MFRSKPVRWACFAAVALGCLVLLMSLPPHQSSRLFLPVAALAVLIKFGKKYRHTSAAESFHTAARWIRAHREGVAAAAAATGIALISLSAVCYNRPDYRSLRKGLDFHIGSFMYFADGKIADGLRLSAQDWSVIGTSDLVMAFWLTLLAGFAFGITLLLTSRAIAWPVPVRSPLIPARSRWLPVGLGILALLVLAETNAPQLGLIRRGGLSTNVQFGLLCGGIGLVVWGLGGGGFPRRLPAIDRREVLAVLAVGTLALVLRAWNLGSAVHRFVDEILYLNAINQVNRDSHVLLLSRFSDVSAFPYLFPYLQAKAVMVLGHNLAAIRAVSALMGTLTVLALYCLARTLFDFKTALLASLFLAVFPPHVHFSRLGLNNVADPLWGTLSLLFLARALRDNRRMDYALGGAALGLTQYFYEGGRLLFPPLVGLWMAGTWLLWRPRVQKRGLLIALLAALIVAAPIYITLIASQDPTTPRMNQVGLGSDYLEALITSHRTALWEAQFRHLIYSLLMYVYLPDTSWFYGSHEPFLLVYAIPAFLLGVLWAIWRWRTPGGLLIVLWLVGAPLGNSLLVSSTDSPRFVAAFPAVALAMAVGVRYTLPLIEPRRLPAAIRTGLAGALVAGLLIGPVVYYFGPFLDYFNVQLRRGYDVDDVLFRSLDLPPGTRVHIVDNTVLWGINIDSVSKFWNADLNVDIVAPSQFNDVYLARLSRDVGHAFFVAPTDPVSLWKLRRSYDLGPPQFSPYNVPRSRQYVLFYIRPWQPGDRYPVPSQGPVPQPE